MKLSEAKKSSIKQEMINDIYEVNIAKLTTLKNNIVVKNHELYLHNLRDVLNTVPDDLLTKGTSLHMSFEYNGQVVNWYASVDNVVICPLKLDRYSNRTIAVPMHTVFEEETIKLYKELLDIVSKKQQFEDYLNKIFSAYSGPKQLIQALPEYLHKYIPKPEPRKPRTKKVKEALPTIEAPEFVREQLVENLLENS